MSYGDPGQCECGRTVDERDWRQWKRADGVVEMICGPCQAGIIRRNHPPYCLYCFESGDYSEATHTRWLEGGWKQLCPHCATDFATGRLP